MVYTIFKNCDDWGMVIIVLPTVFMIYFRTYRPIILNRQITSKYDYAILSSDGAWGLVTHDRSLTSCNVSHSEIPKLPCNTSRPRWIIFELSNCTIIIFGLVVFCSTARKPAIKALMLWLQPLDTPAYSWQVFTAYGMIWVDDSGKPPGNSGLNIPSCW